MRTPYDRALLRLSRREILNIACLLMLSSGHHVFKGVRQAADATCFQRLSVHSWRYLRRSRLGWICYMDMSCTEPGKYVLEQDDEQ